MNQLHSLLSGSVPLLLFAVIGLGWFVGQVRVGSFSLGVSAVLFVGLVFGAIDPAAFVIPEIVWVLGLILFVYTIGLQSGPLFFNLFRRQGVRITLLAVLTTGLAAAGTWVAAKLLGIGIPVGAGIFCGSLTNTPALAAAVERLRTGSAGAGLSPEALRRLLDGPTVGYSLAYPFGVAGLVLAMQLVSRFRRLDFAAEERRGRVAAGLAADDLIIREVEVRNSQIVGRTVSEAFLSEMTGMVFTRVKRPGGEVDLLVPEHRLAAGDILIGVGSAEAVRKAELAVGPLVEAGLERLPSDVDYRDLAVIRRELSGARIADLPARIGAPLIVSRLRRGGIQLAPGPDILIEVGDQIRVVAHEETLERVTKLVGDPIRDFSETDFLSFSLGLIIGVAVGMIPIPIGSGEPLRLGFAGGPLVVGLLLGWLGRTGPIVWTMPTNANLTLRQLGLVLFLAGVGTRAGGSFLATLREQGPLLLLTGAAITTLSVAAIILIARAWLRYDYVSIFGLMTGIHTQPAALAFAADLTKSEGANLSYVAVYPVALVLKIILAQLLVGM
jgi:putative transport protein